MQISSNWNKTKKHILFDNILLLQITLMPGKAAPKMQYAMLCACSATKTSVDAAPLEQITSFFCESFLLFSMLLIEAWFVELFMIEESMK